MIKQSWRDRLIDPRSPDRRPRRAAYALPTMFTAGNVFLGFYALIEAFQGSMAMISDAAAAPHHFRTPRWPSVVGISGRPGRTHRAPDQHRERIRHARWIRWPIRSASASRPRCWRSPGACSSSIPSVDPEDPRIPARAGYFLAFLFLLCGAARLARFNIQKNPVPKNPGRPDRKYFVGLPIPAAAPRWWR